MTQIAIISDIHGNIDALTAVLADARAAAVQRLFVCGDITGYYYDTAAVWRTLSEWDVVICRGNHETILADWVAGVEHENIMRRYGSSYKIAVETLREDELTALLSLEHPAAAIVDNVHFLLTHGAPWDKDLYIYPDMADDQREKLYSYAERYDVVLLGHTHYQMAVAHENLLILNPGSVGQPRSGKETVAFSGQARAQWALYNTTNRTYKLMTSYYDPARVFAQAETYDPHLPYLKTVLKRQDIAT